MTHKIIIKIICCFVLAIFLDALIFFLSLPIGMFSFTRTIAILGTLFVIWHNIKNPFAKKKFTIYVCILIGTMMPSVAISIMYNLMDIGNVALISIAIIVWFFILMIVLFDIARLLVKKYAMASFLLFALSTFGIIMLFFTALLLILQPNNIEIRGN